MLRFCTVTCAEGADRVAGNRFHGNERASTDELWFKASFNAAVPTISSPQELAERMARVARLLQDLIRSAFGDEGREGTLHSQYEAFKSVLIADLIQRHFGL